MTELSKKFFAIVAAIVISSIVIGLGIASIKQIESLNNEISNLNSRITQLDNNDSYTHSRINSLSNEIRNQLEEQSRNYADFGFEITDIDAQDRTASVEVYFSLKESPKDGEVTISYGKGNQFSEIIATRLANGKYMAEIELDIIKEYDISYSVNLTSIITEKMGSINLWHKLKNRFSVSYGYSYSRNEDATIDLFMQNYCQKNDGFKIAAACLEIYNNGALIKTIDIKNDIKFVDGYEVYKDKQIAFSELSFEDFKNADIILKLKITDNYGIEYEL